MASILKGTVRWKIQIGNGQKVQKDQNISNSKFKRKPQYWRNPAPKILKIEIKNWKISKTRSGKKRKSDGNQIFGI